jgi:hypothetical protein
MGHPSRLHGDDRVMGPWLVDWATLAALAVLALEPSPEDLHRALSGPPAKVADVLGEANVQALERGRRIQVARIGVPAPFVTLTPSQVRKAKQLLLSADSYRALALAKLCGTPVPIAVMRVVGQGGPPIDLHFSFNCDQFEIRSPDGKRTTADFSPASIALAELLAVVLRNDKVLTGIVAKRRRALVTCTVPIDRAIPLLERALYSCSCPPARPPIDNYEEVLGQGTHLARVCASARCDPADICQKYESLDRPGLPIGCRSIAPPIAFPDIDDAHRVACTMQPP